MMSARNASHRPAAVLETLEGRQMLSSASQVGGVLTIEGNADSTNRVVLRVTTRGRESMISALINGQRRFFPRRELTGISVVGGNLRDSVSVGSGVRLPVTIDGRDGPDVLAGGGGNDTIRGGPGNDVIRGNAGNDYIDGGAGSNLLYGGSGANTLVNIVPRPDHVPPDYGVATAVLPPDSRQTGLVKPDGAVQTFGVDVTRFKNADGSYVAPGDGKDDTVGLQRAIDSLNPYWGFPMGSASMGGTLYLPAGEYVTSSPLRMPGNIILSGDGVESVIHYTGSTGAAVELVESEDSLFASAAGLQNLTVMADRAGGVGVHASRKIYMLQLRFRDITLDTAGWGIDFRGHQTQNGFFENVTQRNLGAGALRIEGNANKVLGVVTEGPVREGFNADPAVIVVKGDGNRIADCVVGPLPEGRGSAFYVSGYFPSMSNNRAEVAGIVPSVSDGIAFTFEGVEGGTVDDLWGRKARFIDTPGLQIRRQWAGLDVTDLGQLFFLEDAASDVLIDELAGPGVTDGAGRAALIGAAENVRVTRWQEATAVAYFDGMGQNAQSSTTPVRAVGGNTYGVSAKDFLNVDGKPVKGDIASDDTTGIQRAIDSLSVPRELPGGGAAVGGVVYLPSGVYRTTAPLWLPNGVVLVGDGAATVIRYEGNVGAAVQFNPSQPGGTVTGAGVENLCINAERTGAVIATPGTTLDRVRVQDVVLNCLGWGVDLRGVTTRNSAFDNVHQRNMGTGSVWVEGDRNRFFAVNTEFGVRPGFAVEPALLVVKGNDNIVVGAVVEGVPTRTASAIYVSGTGLHWGYNWAEIQDTGYVDAKNGDAFIFENVSDVAYIDNLHILGTRHRGRFINSRVRIEQINNMAENYPLRDYLVLDGTSTIDVDWAIVRWWGTGPLEGTGIRITNLFLKAEAQA